jgi:hypothetical protein
MLLTKLFDVKVKSQKLQQQQQQKVSAFRLVESLIGGFCTNPQKGIVQHKMIESHGGLFARRSN